MHTPVTSLINKKLHNYTNIKQILCTTKLLLPRRLFQNVTLTIIRVEFHHQRIIFKILPFIKSKILINLHQSPSDSPSKLSETVS